MTDVTDPIVTMLEEKHPRWIEMIDQWREIDDVLFDRVRLRKGNYLPQGADESTEDYDLRKRVARFKGEVAGLLHRVVGAVFMTAPVRNDQLAEEWSDLIENADGSGLDLTSYLEESLFEALGFGAALIIVDRPQTNDEGLAVDVVSRNFELSVDERPLEDDEIDLIRYKLPQLVNWQVDRRGEPIWIRIHEVDHRKPTSFSDPIVVEVYREWDRGSWRIWEVEVILDEKTGKRTKTATMVGQGDHNLGIVPLAVLSAHGDRRQFRFESAIRYAYNYDLDIFRDQADLAYDTFQHAHPTTLRKMDRGKSRNIVVGAGSTIDLEPEESVEYMQYPTGATDQLRKNIESHQQGIQRAGGVDPLGASDSASAMGASGTARKIAFTVGEARFLRRYSRATRNVETRIFEIAERWTSGTENPPAHDNLNDKPPTYPQRFDSQDASVLIEDWQMSRSGINSDRLDREVQKKIADSLVPDIPADIREEIMEEIEKNELIGKQPEEPEGEDVNDPGDTELAMDELEDVTANELGMEDEDASREEAEAATA